MTELAASQSAGCLRSHGATRCNSRGDGPGDVCGTTRYAPNVVTERKAIVSRVIRIRRSRIAHLAQDPLPSPERDCRREARVMQFFASVTHRLAPRAIGR